MIFITGKITALLPHEVVVLDDNNEVVEIIAVSGLARVAETSSKIDMINGKIPLMNTVYGQPVGLPEVEDGVYYVVSKQFADAVPHRKDLMLVKNLVRDSKGTIIGCKGLEFANK